MARIIVLGGTGYAGRHIVTEAVSRGHAVIAISRSAPGRSGGGGRISAGAPLSTWPRSRKRSSARTPWSRLSRRAVTWPTVRSRRCRMSSSSSRVRTRVSASSAVPAGVSWPPAGRACFDQGFPEEYKHEAQVGIDSLALLEATDAGLDWFFIHPAEVFGPWAEGDERTGHYRDGWRRDRPRRRRQVVHLGCRLRRRGGR